MPLDNAVLEKCYNANGRRRFSFMCTPCFNAASTLFPFPRALNMRKGGKKAQMLDVQMLNAVSDANRGSLLRGIFFCFSK
jgi:hypothetical protein